MSEANSYVMMALGDFRFSIDTAAFEDLQRSSCFRWAQIDRIGARPSLQFIGPGEDTVTLQGSIYPAYRGGLGQVSQMREAAAGGEALAMIDGTGRVWGNFVITDVREGQKIFFSNGQPRAQTFEMELKMYDESPGSGDDGVSGSAGDDASALTGSPEDAIGGLSSLGDVDTWLPKVASTTLLSNADARSLLPLSTDGLARIGSAIQIGASALSNGDLSVDVLRRSASALTDSFSQILTPAAYSVFAASGINLNSIIADATGAPFDAVLAAMKTATGSDIAAAVTSNPDMATVYRGLMDALHV